MKAVGIIVAGGSGKRFGGRIRKQYMKLAGKPLLWWSLQAFQKAESIKMVVLVVPQTDRAALQKSVRQWKFPKPISVVEGGKERSDSVRHGLDAAPAGLEWVAVHDAVRPLIPASLIEHTLREAQESGAAIAATRAKETVKITNGHAWVHSSPPRETVWFAQTPQCFSRSLLERAHHKFKNKVVTDDAQMVERLGVKVKLIEGAPENIKVTVPADLEMAKFWIKQRHVKAPLTPILSPKERG